ncbi:MAG TPA: hypothetical protein VK486_17315 [Thermoleophilaceae bacterium]|nr:hypothetical protein [Thermoleophilaceae bacterium]
MPDTPSITLVKRFIYRGVFEEWSNTYHFSGTTPTNDAGWVALGDAIWTSEKTCYTSDHARVKMYGYEAGNEHSIFQRDYVAEALPVVAGTLGVASTDQKMSGDQAAWIRGLVGLSSRGKKVYVRKYLHGGTCKLASPDEIAVGYKSALNQHASTMVGGTLPGGAKWCGPQGAVVGALNSSTFVTTRTLKRRGKRP